MHRVKCYYCGQYFDRDKEPAVKLENMNRYAHEKCNLDNANPTRQEQIELEEYIKNGWNVVFIPPFIIDKDNHCLKQYPEDFLVIKRLLKK